MDATMSQAASHPALVRIADEIDAVGQRLRLFRILRGGMLWAAGLVVSTFLACIIAHLAREGRGTIGLSIVWIAWLIGSFAWWLGRPLLMRPRAIAVARLVEQRVDGLHNGLSNSLLLAEADDLQESPWLGAIFNEVLGSTQTKPITAAVRFAALETRRRSVRRHRCMALAIVLVFPAPFAHGFRQLFSPGAFVPKAGDAHILDVQPGDATIVAGQALEIVAPLMASRPMSPI